jgi:hypothetical protein
MPALTDDLKSFAYAVVFGQELSLQLQVFCPRYPVATAVAVYRNNYRGNLQDTLAYAYPVVEQLVGQEFFRCMAKQFIEQHPSRSGNLHLYGAEMAAFIAAYESAQSLDYLSDVAALEWCCHCAYFAEDGPTLDIGRLASISAERYAELVLRTHQAVYVMHSRHPVAAIWHAHQGGDVDDFEVDWERAAHTILISRQNNTVVVSELTEADGAWLQILQEGATLGNATDAIAQYYPDFNLESALLKFVAQGVITDFTLGRSS